MKILKIVGHTTGGIGSHVKALNQDLCSLGEQVHILCPKEVAESFDLQNCTKVWPSFGISYSKFSAFIKALFTFREYIRSSDIVHIHGNKAAFFALLVCRKADRSKVVVTLHNKIILTGVQEVVSRFTRKIVARRAQVVSGVSSDLIADAKNDGAKNTFIAPIFAPRVDELLVGKFLSVQERNTNFLNLVNELGLPLDLSKPLVLSVCRIAPQKAIDDIVRIANSGIDANFVVIGSGVDALLDDLKAMDTGNKVFFAGRREDVDKFLQAANVMLLTSKWEGNPLVLQEAMANGLPIVSTFGGGIPDLVYDNNTGLKAGVLSEVGDWENMSLSVKALLDDEKTWKDYAESGRKIASTWKNRDEIALFWKKVYEDL